MGIPLYSLIKLAKFNTLNDFSLIDIHYSDS
jgi:hypothetical protein